MSNKLDQVTSILLRPVPSVNKVAKKLSLAGHLVKIRRNAQNGKSGNHERSEEWVNQQLSQNDFGFQRIDSERSGPLRFTIAPLPPNFVTANGKLLGYYFRSER